VIDCAWLAAFSRGLYSGPRLHVPGLRVCIPRGPEEVRAAVMSLENLGWRQRKFVEAYLGEAHWNATKAAIIAGYSKKTAYSIGWENLRKPEIKAAIAERISEAAMAADEVLARLADQARGSMEEFSRENGRLDLAAARKAGKYHLVKSLKHGKDGDSVELYDAQSALVQLGRHHKLFTDRKDITTDGRPIATLNDAELLALLQEGAVGGGGAPGVEDSPEDGS
jgi:phage terminase small subunit